MANFICINCKENHKFSPFNVTKDPYTILPNVLPLLIIDSKTKNFNL